MSDSPNIDETQAAVSPLVLKEQLCDAFESAWLAGKRPQIEDSLARMPASLRGKLLADLLEIELDFRQKAGETLLPDAYVSRFPDHAESIREIFVRVVKCRRLGDYELQEELGHGGMGVVYKARHTLLNQTVAVKVLPDRFLDAPTALSRFRREMQSLGGLDHPNVVRAHNAGEANGKHFLVMEYVDGLNLQLLLTHRVETGAGPLSVAVACEVVRQAAIGLQYAYEKGLVHRDIKPANLMLSRSGVVKILDLGLAKLHSDHRPLDERSGPLTQAGTTIGTIDYMAPEQWEDSSNVDIRADIYSLGCTLFFLLTGEPPFGGKSFDTSRRKLMAHAVAPVPSLAAVCRGCPAELDRIVAFMMAKEPEDRFDTPAEVADGMEDFADPNGLATLAHDVLQTQTGITSGQQTRDSATETPHHSSGRSSRESKRSVLARESRRVRRRNLLAATATLCAVVMLLAGVVWIVRSKDQPMKPGHQAGRENNGAIVPGTDKSLTFAQHRDNLVLLPGLNGQWWFDEMPWYTPFVREAVGKALQSPEEQSELLSDKPGFYFDTNTPVVQNALWKIVGRCRQSFSDSESRLLDTLKGISEEDANDSELVEKLEKAVVTFEQDHAEEDWPAADRHSLALLQHKLAAIQENLSSSRRTNRQWAEDAKKNYDEALEHYQIPNLLRSLCLADSALLCSRLLGDYQKDDSNAGEGRSRFRASLKSADNLSLFKAVTLDIQGTEATNHASGLEDYEIGLFEDAADALKNLEEETRISFNYHPIRAQIYADFGWSLMDQWKVNDARVAFRESQRILDFHRDPEKWLNPFAEIKWLHARHGLAIASRYQGNVRGARKMFGSLVGDVLFDPKGSSGEIKKAIDKVGLLPKLSERQRCVRDLNERWSNSAERWADCDLYGGAASNNADVNLDRACKLYDHSRHIAPDTGTRVVITCKYCMALALHGDVGTAQDIFDAEVNNKDVLGPDRERAPLIRRLTAAVLLLKTEGKTNDGQDAIRKFLTSFEGNDLCDANRRETLELRLFAAELLLSFDIQSSDGKAADADDIVGLASLLKPMRDRDKMLPFLRRYYELLVRAIGKDQPAKMAKYLLLARGTQKSEDEKDGQATTHVVFHFAANGDPNPGDNYAIVMPPDVVVALPFTRQEIRDAANTGRLLAMPEELLKLVEEEQKDGRTTILSWDDTECFEERGQGLSKDDWMPFAKQLDYETLKKP